MVQFREALDDYLDPEEEASAATAGGQGTIEFLLRRMRHKERFPGAVGGRSAQSTRSRRRTASIGKLSSTILRTSR